jgi:hypothetical protein
MVSAEAGASLRGEDGAPFPRDIWAPARVLALAAESADIAPLLEAAAAGLR